MSRRCGVTALVAVFAVASITLGAPLGASACECGSTLDWAFDHAHAVVIAERTSPNGSEALADFRTIEVLKGVVASTFTVTEDRSSCGIRTEQGVRYVLFLRQGSEPASASGPFGITICEPNMRIDDPAEEHSHASTLATLHELAARDRARAREAAYRRERSSGARAREAAYLGERSAGACDGSGCCAVRLGNGSPPHVAFALVSLVMTVGARRRRRASRGASSSSARGIIADVEHLENPDDRCRATPLDSLPPSRSSHA